MSGHAKVKETVGILKPNEVAQISRRGGSAWPPAQDLRREKLMAVLRVGRDSYKNRQLP
jgi:hypothetical protein